MEKKMKKEKHEEGTRDGEESLKEGREEMMIE